MNIENILLRILLSLVSTMLALIPVFYRYSFLKKSERLLSEYKFLKVLHSDLQKKPALVRFSLEKYLKTNIPIGEVRHIFSSDNFSEYIKDLKRARNKLVFIEESTSYKIKNRRISTIWAYSFYFLGVTPVLLFLNFIPYLYENLSLEIFVSLSLSIFPFWLYLAIISVFNLISLVSAKKLEKLGRTQSLNEEKKMNKEEVIHALYLCMVGISEKYLIFEALFRNRESIETLSQHDYGIYSVFQDALANDLIASIFRILDPEKSCGKKNLSFKYLEKNYSLPDSLNKKIDELYKIKTRIKLYRHTIVAHNSLEHILNPEEQKKILFEWGDISKVVTLGQDILREIYKTEYKEEREFLPSNTNPDLFLNDLKSNQ